MKGEGSRVEIIGRGLDHRSLYLRPGHADPHALTAWPSGDGKKKGLGGVIRRFNPTVYFSGSRCRYGYAHTWESGVLGYWFADKGVVSLYLG